MADRAEVRVTFEALADPDGVAVAVRVRDLLKHALRRCYLKCVLIEVIDHVVVDGKPTDPGEARTG